MRAASARLEGKLASEHTDSVNLLRELQLRDSLSACKPLCFNELQECIHRSVVLSVRPVVQRVHPPRMLVTPHHFPRVRISHNFILS